VVFKTYKTNFDHYLRFKKNQRTKQNLPQTISFLLTFIHQNYQIFFPKLKINKGSLNFQNMQKPKPLIEGFMILDFFKKPKHEAFLVLKILNPITKG
jgi:hypothetical protein